MEARRHFMIVFLLTLSYSLLEANHDDCNSILKCNKRVPPVHFPFKLRHHHPDHCGYPAFDLYCSAKTETILKLPFSREFIVTNIDYESQFLDVADPDGCIPRRVLKQLNFSSFPFHRFKVKRWKRYEIIRDYDLVEKNLTFINCSAEWRANDFHFPIHFDSDYSDSECLGEPGYEVYALPTENSLNRKHWIEFSRSSGSYRQIKTTPNVLMQYIDMFNGYKFSLRFSWSIEVCGSCKVRGMRCRLKNRYIPPFAECF